jgi:polyprenyl-phospho-N-acetylgalactosaminyl synthase
MKAICIIPAFNEERSIKKVINDVRPMVDEIVIVDDASSDQTSDLAEQAKVTVLRHIVNRGQGASLETGDQYALANDADIVVHFDADGQFRSEDIKSMIEPILSGRADIVFGSRFKGLRSDMPWSKEFVIMPLARMFNFVFFRSDLTDPQSGFRALNRKALERIRIGQDKMAHCSEIISKAFRYGLKIEEVPIKVIYNEFGLRFSGGFRIIKDFFINLLIT